MRLRLCDNQIDGTRDLGVKLDLNGMCTEGLDGILHLQLAAVDLDAVLCLDGFFNVLCGDGTVDAAVSTRTCSELDDNGLQLCGGIARILLVYFDFVQASTLSGS